MIYVTFLTAVNLLIEQRDGNTGTPPVFLLLICKMLKTRVVFFS